MPARGGSLLRPIEPRPQTYEVNQIGKNMLQDLKKTDIQQRLVTPAKSLPSEILKTDVISQPQVPVDAPAEMPNPVAKPGVLDELLKYLALSLAGRLGNSIENGGSEAFDDAIKALLDQARSMAKCKAQGSLSDSEFQRAQDKAAAKFFAGAMRTRTQDQLENALLRAAAEIAAISTEDIALLPEEFLEPLHELTKADLFNFGLQGGVSVPLEDPSVVGGQSILDGIQPTPTTPVFIAVGTNLVKCNFETSPTGGDDEFRISVVGSMGGNDITPVLFNDRDCRKKFMDDGDSLLGRDEYARAPVLVNAKSTYRLVGTPYEEDRLSKKEVKELVDKLRDVLEGAGDVLGPLIDEAITKISAGVNPVLALSIILLRRYLASSEIVDDITSKFFAILSSFVSDLPFADNDLFTPFSLSGVYSRGFGDETIEATLTASVGALDQNTAGFPATVRVKFNDPNKRNGEAIKTIGNVTVRELPIGARGSYEFTAIVVLRDKFQKPTQLQTSKDKK